MSWSKDADWIPLSNAVAMVKFWKKDLEYSEKYLKWVKSLDKIKDKKGNNIAHYAKFLKIAQKDVSDSKDGLAKAIAKLESTEKRVSKQ